MKPTITTATLLLALAGSTQALADDAFPAQFELSSLDGTNGFVLRGVDQSDDCGSSVSSAGDVNDDGITDLIIGASSANPNGIGSGASYVVFGRDGLLVAFIDLASLNGTNGFALSGESQFDMTGGSVSSAGDINDDGVDDIIIGATGAKSNGILTGASYVVFGVPAPSPADLSADGNVNAADLAILLAAWSTPDADLNADNTTNSADLAILLAAWTG